jgi:aminoglycoside phosphotransferase (APT) family kinase protein
VNALYRLGEELVVRLPRVQGWADDLVKEARWLPTLAPALPLSVPTPIAMGMPADGYPFDWAIYRWLPGGSLQDARQLDLDQVTEALVEFVRAIRNIPLDDAPRSRRDRPLADRDAEVRAAVAAIGDSLDCHAALGAWEQSVGAEPWGRESVWTHGDLLPPNLLTEEGLLTGVIDFGNMGAGDPAVDLIPAWTVLSGEHRATFRAALPDSDDTWLRARGMALHQALLIIPYYAETNPSFVATAIETVNEVVADCHGR